MLKTTTGHAVVGLLCILGAVFASNAFCQDFPYLVPAAPEFDSSGNLVKNAPSHQPVANSFSSPTSFERPEKYPDFNNPPKVRIPTESSRPTAERSAPPRARTYGPRTVAGPPPNSAAPVGAPPGMAQAPTQQAQDCSQYPYMIAGAGSEGEMQMVARQYLTCLMQNGLDMQTAKNLVISVIETQFRYRR